MIWTSGDVCLFLFKTFDLNGNFQSEKGHLSLTFTTNKWGSSPGEHFMSLLLLSKSTASLDVLEMVLTSPIEDWADNNDFKFSQSKTVCVHFCRGRGLHPDPYLVLYNNPITPLLLNGNKVPWHFT